MKYQCVRRVWKGLEKLKMDCLDSIKLSWCPFYGIVVGWWMGLPSSWSKSQKDKFGVHIAIGLLRPYRGWASKLSNSWPKGCGSKTSV